MGLLTQALAGGVAGGADSISRSMDDARKFDVAQMLENSRQQHAENMMRLQDTLANNRADSGMVNSETGAPLTRADLANLDNKGVAQNAQEFNAENAAQTKIDFTPVAQDVTTGKLYMAGDEIPQGDNIRNFSKEQQLQMQADLAHKQQETATSKQKGELYAGGGRQGASTQLYQAKLDEIDNNPNLTDDEKEARKDQVTMQFGKSGTAAIKPPGPHDMDRWDAAEKRLRPSLKMGIPPGRKLPSIG